MFEQLVPSKTQRSQIALLVFCALIIVVTKYIKDHNGPTEAMIAMAANCNFEKPGLALVDKYPKAAKWCRRHRDEREMTSLINHLKIYCKSDACSAPEFGSNVAVLYVPSLQLAMINPKIAMSQGAKTVEMIDCEIETRQNILLFKVQSPLEVDFINEQFVDSKVYLKNMGACLISQMLETLYT